MQQDIDEPAKYLQINLYTQTIGNIRYTYFFAKKNNENLFGTHMRFFILRQDLVSQIKQFGYARQLPKNAKVPFREQDKVPERKFDFIFDHLNDIKYDKKQTLEVIFNHTGKVITWQIKPQNQRLAENVFKLLDNARTAILNVVHNDPVNQTSEVLKETKIGEQKKQNVPGEVKMAELPSTNPFAAQEGEKDQQKEKDKGENKEKDQATGAQRKDGSVVELRGDKSLTFGAGTGNEEVVNNIPEPIKFSLLNLSEQNMKEKEEFIKKIEEQKLKDQKTEIFKYSNNKDLTSTPNTQQTLKSQKQIFVRRQQVISTKNQLWNYQFIKGNEENLVYEFKEFSENFVAQLIDELCLPEEQRLYKPTDRSTLFEIYEELGLNIRLCFTGISEIKLLKNSKETIFDETEIKKAIKQFKNMNYLLKITRNKGKIRLPLANIVEYKGIIALVKAEVDFNEEQPVSLLNELQIISKQARIGKQVFSNPKCLKILPLSSKIYESRMNRLDSSKKQREIFSDTYFIDDVNHFLPTDLNFVDKDPESLILRPELLQNEDFDGMELMGVSVSPFLNKIKTERNVQMAVTELESAAKKLKQNVESILQQWQALDVIVLNSKQVEILFHKHGVNMRYLGLVYDKATVPIVRKICMSEIISRAAKIVFRASVQQMMRTYPVSLTVQESFKKDKELQIIDCNNHLINNLIEFLNGIVAETEASEFFWKSLNKQAEYNFNVAISRHEIAEKYFIQALIHHLNIDFDWSKFSRNSALFGNKLFRRDMIRQFNAKSKNYNLQFTDLYIKINYLLEEASPQSAEQIKSILNLRKLNIPEHFRLNGTFDRICMFLSDYVKPETKQTSAQVLLANAIYEMSLKQPVNFVSLTIALSEIKWMLKENNVVQAEKLVKQLINRISDWCGDTHPIYTEIYSVFAQFYAIQGKFEDALNYSKTALANEQKILGGKHLKIAQRYYELAEIGLKASRKQDSLNNYNKAKNICNNIGESQSVFYAQVCYKIAAVSFQFDKLAEAQNSILSSVEIYEMNRGEQGHFENQTVQCYELLMRSYQARGKKEQMQKISFYCAENIQDFNDLPNIERVMRIYLTPYFLGVKRKQAQKMVELFQQIPLQSNNSSYSLAYTYIRKLIDTNKLMPTITEIFDNFDELYEEAVSSSILTRWRRFEGDGKSIPHQCLSLVEALIYFVGEGFVIGSLQEK